MKPIKFRGKDINGHYVYGLLTKKTIRNNGNLSYAIAGGRFTQGETIPVNEKSVALFLGYDKNGNEIYSDDRIRVYNYDCRRKVIFFRAMNAEDFFTFSDIGQIFNDIELLEERGKNEN